MTSDVLDRTVTGEVWETLELPVQGRREVTLSVTSPAGTSAGWGELVAF